MQHVHNVYIIDQCQVKSATNTLPMTSIAIGTDMNTRSRTEHPTTRQELEEGYVEPGI